MSDTISIFACEPQPIVIEGLRGVLSGTPEFTFSGSSADLSEGVEGIRQTQPHVVLIDHLYGLKPISQFVTDLKAISPRTCVVIWVVDWGADQCFRALQIGARGVLRKNLSIAVMLDCLRAASSGRIWVQESPANQPYGHPGNTGLSRITPREQEIIACICRGMRNREIGLELGIATGTVKVHLMHIFEKTGVKDRFELALHWKRLVPDTFDGTDTPVSVA